MSRFVRNSSHLLKQITNKWSTNNTMTIRACGMSSMCSRVMMRRIAPQLQSSLVIAKRFNSSDVELKQFLSNEIELEKKTQKRSLPSFSGWKITTDGSNVTLTRSDKSEEIAVKFNVNHAVDADNDNNQSVDEPTEQSNQNPSEMVCRPDFAVEIKRNNQILGINCSFVTPEVDDDPRSAEFEQMSDDFQIDEIAIYESEFKTNSYAIAGDVMDGNMYDLMMELLHIRGVDDVFVKNLIEYATVYEHSQYITLLEKLNNFIN